MTPSRAQPCRCGARSTLGSTWLHASLSTWLGSRNEVHVPIVPEVQPRRTDSRISSSLLLHSFSRNQLHHTFTHFFHHLRR